MYRSSIAIWIITLRNLFTVYNIYIYFSLGAKAIPTHTENASLGIAIVHARPWFNLRGTNVHLVPLSLLFLSHRDGHLSRVFLTYTTHQRKHTRVLYVYSVCVCVWFSSSLLYWTRDSLPLVRRAQSVTDTHFQCWFAWTLGTAPSWLYIVIWWNSTYALSIHIFTDLNHLNKSNDEHTLCDSCRGLSVTCTSWWMGFDLAMPYY